MENKLDKTSSSKETEIIQWPPTELETAQIFAHWHCGSHTVFVHVSWSFTSFTSSVTKEKGSHRFPCVILLHLHAKTELLSLRTFESVHDVLVVSHLQGVDLVSGISGSGDFSHLAARACRWMKGGVVMETGHWDGTRCRLRGTLWKAFIDSCPNELISGLLLGYPLSLYKGSPISCRLKDCSGCFKVALSMLRFYKCQTTSEVSSSCSMNNIPDISLHNL